MLQVFISGFERKCIRLLTVSERVNRLRCTWGHAASLRFPPVSVFSSVASYRFTLPSLAASLFSRLFPDLIKMPSSIHWWAPCLLLFVLYCSVNMLCHVRSPESTVSWVGTLVAELPCSQMVLKQFDCATIVEMLSNYVTERNMGNTIFDIGV